jgi:hypothetical protein
MRKVNWLKRLLRFGKHRRFYPAGFTQRQRVLAGITAGKKRGDQPTSITETAERLASTTVYIPDPPPTDLTLLPAVNESVLPKKSRYTTWDRHHLSLDFFKWWRWQ